MPDRSLLAIAISVFTFLGYYTYQLQQGVNPQSLVVATGQAATIKVESAGFTIALDSKWHLPSEAGKAWLSDVWALSDTAGASPTEQFICPRPACEQTAVLTVMHGTEAVNATDSVSELDAPTLKLIFDGLGCDPTGQRDAQNLSLSGALGYHFTCQTVSGHKSADTLFLDFVFWKKEHFILRVLTFPGVGRDYDVHLTDEAAKMFVPS